MKRRIIALCAILTLVTFVGVVRTISKARRVSQTITDKPPAHDLLRWYAERAKAKGQKEVEVGSLILDYGGGALTGGFEGALSDYSVMVGRVSEKKSFTEDGDHIMTWYKFEIVDSISQRKPLSCLQCDRIHPPIEMLPVQANQFLLEAFGGRLLIDGVVVNEESFPSLNENQKYLLFASRDPSGITMTAGGPTGVFIVGDGGVVKPISKEDNGLHEAMEEQFGNSIEKLRLHLQSLPIETDQVFVPAPTTPGRRPCCGRKLK